MKTFTAIAFAALAASASAQLDNVPSCALLNCLTPGLAKTGCSILDFACSCSNEAYIVDSVVCSDKQCTTEADKLAAISSTNGLCKGVGIDISGTVSSVLASISGGAAAPSSTAAPAPSSSAAPASTSAAPSASASASGSASASASKSSAAPSSSSKTNVTSTGAPPQATGSAAKFGAAGSLVALGLAVAAAF